MSLHQAFLACWRGEQPTPEQDADIQRWWAHLPDFFKPTYPFDVPPERMPFARYVFAQFGDVPRTCPIRACQRSRECRGGEGPPCYRARREELRHLLLHTWISLYHPEIYGEEDGEDPSSGPQDGAWGKRR
ncbi:MAG TPA: hypothetical protein VF744_13760 [Beijerinckiaceae bacterium]